MSERPTPTLFGFPIQVRPGFVLFLALITFVYGGSLGFWVAGTIGVFTLIHELGHAFAARMTGARSSISLDFLVAYAAFRPTHELKWWERISIAAAGPALQMFVGIVALVAMGTNPLSRSSITSSDASLAVWWASIALGALNLIPVLPLDGGAIVSAIATALSPQRGRFITIQVSIALTIATIIAMLTTGFAEPLLPFAAFLLIMQFQMRGVMNAIERQSRQPTGEPRYDAMVMTSLIATEQPRAAIEFGLKAWRSCPSALIAESMADALRQTGQLREAELWTATAQRLTL